MPRKVASECTSSKDFLIDVINDCLHLKCQGSISAPVQSSFKFDTKLGIGLKLDANCIVIFSHMGIQVKEILHSAALFDSLFFPLFNPLLSQWDLFSTRLVWAKALISSAEHEKKISMAWFLWLFSLQFLTYQSPVTDRTFCFTVSEETTLVSWTS